MEKDAEAVAGESSNADGESGKSPASLEEVEERVLKALVKAWFPYDRSRSPDRWNH